MKNKLPNAILTADWHLRDSVPRCRIDDYWNAQWNSVQFILDLQTKYQILIIDAGDLFHQWKSSPYLLAKTLQILDTHTIVTIPGNHDLPNHNLDLFKKCGLNVLQNRSVTSILSENNVISINKQIDVHGIPWDCSIKNKFKFKKEFNILLIHTLVCENKDDFPGVQSIHPKAILKKYPEYDLILSGHNHKSFEYEYKGRLLINPGSLMRMSADQKEHKPRVYLWYAETNTVKKVYIPIEKDVFDTKYLVKKEERTDRMDSFISSMTDNYEVDLDFNLNMENYFNENRTHRKIKQMVYDCLEN